MSDETNNDGNVQPAAPAPTGDNDGNAQLNAGDIRRSTTSNLLNTVGSALGAQFKSVEDLVAFASNQASVETPKAPAPQAAPEDGSMKERLGMMEKMLVTEREGRRSAEMNSLLSTKITEHGFNPEYADVVKGDFQKHMNIKDDGSVEILDEHGKVWIKDDGSLASIDDAAEVIKAKRSLLLKDYAPTGGGLRADQSGHAQVGNIAEMSDADFQQWYKNETHKGMIGEVSIKDTNDGNPW